eukprot:gene11714-12935_t
MKYKLIAFICHHAVSAENGHYSAHIIKGATITTYDDSKIEKRPLENILQLLSTLESVHLLSFFLQDTESCISCGTMSEKYWFGLLQPRNTQADIHDARTACNSTHFNGDRISQVLYAIASKETNKSLVTTSDNFFADVKRHRIAAEYSHMLEVDFLKIDAMVIPINVDRQHWVMACIYPCAKCIVVMDSMRDSTQGRGKFEVLVKFLRLHAAKNDAGFAVNEWVLVVGELFPPFQFCSATLPVLAPRHLPVQEDTPFCGVLLPHMDTTA